MRGRRWMKAGMTVVGVSLVATACGGGHAQTNTSSPPDASRAAEAWTKTWSSGHRDEASHGVSADGKAVASAPASRAPVAAYDARGGDAVAVDPPVNPVPDPAPVHVDTTLNAGSVDDNAKWAEYLNYREQALRSGITVHDVDITTREVVHVVDRDGKPVLGAKVELRDADTTIANRTTYADGSAMFFPPKSTGQDASPRYTVSVALGDSHADAPLDRETHDHIVKLDTSVTVADPVPLDVVFLIDATGSMGDEIEQLKANMASVAKEIDKLSPRPDVRFGMTVFRDRGDEFVTRNFDLTADVASFDKALAAVVADGGGDTPESVNAGLHDALNAQHWRGDDTIKMIFLVGDAAPHLDYPGDADYAKDMAVAAERGITIDPIASSGLDDTGEYVFRQMAQYTSGRFNFLTYGADGHSPGTSTPHHVDDYSVLSLDQLVVKLVTDEIASLKGTPSGS